MEFSGPDFCAVGDHVEFTMVYQKGYKNISFRVVDPSGKEFVPIVSQRDDPMICLISFTTSAIGMYKINMYKNNLCINKPNVLLSSGNCFAFNLDKERWEMELIYWSLEVIELVMEMRMHHPVVNHIIAQAHLLSPISNSINPYVVVQCHPNILPDKNCKFCFIPPQYGSYEIRFYCNTPSPGPRPQVHVINTTKWKLIHSFTTERFLTPLQQKVSFIFELSGAPSEFLKAWVKCPDKTCVTMLLYGEEKHNKIGQLRCDFMPSVIGPHTLIAFYQNAMFDKCPLEFHVSDATMVELVSISPDINAEKSFSVGENLTITYKGPNSMYDQISVNAIASEDSGIYSPVPVDKSVKDNEGIVTFVINLPISGKYIIEGSYIKQKINSFEIEVISPLKIIVPHSEDLKSKKSVESCEDQVKEELINPINAFTELVSAPTPNKNAQPPEELSNITPIVSGEGLVEAEVGKSAVFVVDPQGEKGKLTVDVTGPRSLAKCLIKPESSCGRYDVEYDPKEIGLYEISILWNDQPLPRSPFKVEATDPKSIRCVSHSDIFNEVLHISAGRKTRIDFSHSLAGNGRMSAFVKRNDEDIKIKSWTTVTKILWTFWVESIEEGNFEIEIFWNNRMLGMINVKCERNDDLSPEITDDPVSQIILKGSGLKGSWVGQIAKFLVDTFNVGHGKLLLSLNGTKPEMENIPVIVERQPNGTYECSYQAVIPGKYLLHVSWGDTLVKGSPFPINIWSKDPSRVVKCRGDGLNYGLVGEVTSVVVDVSDVCNNHLSKPNEVEAMLSATFVDPDKIPAICELIKQSDMLYQLNMQAITSGRHQLNVMYGNAHVPGSPFYPYLTEKQSLEKLKVFGPGLESSHLHSFESYFTVDTSQAGVGKLRVQVRGPKEAFRVEVQKISADNRLIKYSYNPTETGEYTISINWSGCPIIGSPFQIFLD